MHHKVCIPDSYITLRMVTTIHLVCLVVINPHDIFDWTGRRPVPITSQPAVFTATSAVCYSKLEILASTLFSYCPIQDYRDHFKTCAPGNMVLPLHLTALAVESDDPYRKPRYLFGYSGRTVGNISII